MSPTPSHSPKDDAIPTKEDHRARFYEDYRKVSEEYDKDFLKKHDEDLNTTLIFVSSARGFDELALTRGTGRIVLCSHRRIYHRGRPQTPIRSQRRDRSPPSCSDLQHR